MGDSAITMIRWVVGWLRGSGVSGEHDLIIVIIISICLLHSSLSHLSGP